ncbi:hypothetical protein [Neptunicella sp.]|uniref:hypothetical protein n=1 Tax=Neptunicella sp. TaxID=2125986 RepID=UPI003F694695
MNIEKWEATRTKGKKRFIWINGFIGWGITTAVLWSLIMQIIQPQDEIWVRPLIALLLFPLGGLVWAHFVWQATEKKYLKDKDTPS